LALLHFSCAATVGIRKKFHLTGGLEAKAEVTVPSLDDWEKEGERAENVESGKLKCATKVAPGGFQVAVGGHRAITLTCIHSLSTKPGQARVRLKLLFPENAAMITNIITILLNYLNLAFTEQPIWSGVF
jgi:hypothetical protein